MKVLRLVFVGMLFLCESLKAAEPSSAAKVRAASYQAEARKLLERSDWVIAHDRPGEFTAIHRAFPVRGAGFGAVAAYGPQTRASIAPMLAHLTLTFRPISTTDTQCSARLVGYYTHTNEKTGKPYVTGPFNANSAEMTKYVTDLMAKAEKRLVRAHPEYMPGSLAY